MMATFSVLNFLLVQHDEKDLSATMNVMLASLRFLLLLFADLHQVKPTNVLVSQNCLNESNSCISFSELLEHPNDYFTSNTVVEFQPGEYSTEAYGVNSTISIVGVSNLTITGSSNELCRIRCSGSYSVSFRIDNCTNIALSWIEFNDCMHIIKLPKTPELCPFLISNCRKNSTLVIEHTMNTTFYNIKVLNNKSMLLA